MMGSRSFSHTRTNSNNLLDKTRETASLLLRAQHNMGTNFLDHKLHTAERLRGIHGNKGTARLHGAQHMATMVHMDFSKHSGTKASGLTPALIR